MNTDKTTTTASATPDKVRTIPAEKPTDSPQVDQLCELRYDGQHGQIWADDARQIERNLRVHIIDLNDAATRFEDRAKRAEAQAAQLAEALRQCLGFIEMKLAHTGNMNVEQIMRALETVKGNSQVSTAHHIGCKHTTRTVNLDFARQALAAYEAAR